VAADSLWWSVWWRWLLVWIGTGLALVAAALIGLAHWRGGRKHAQQPPYLSFYLHEQSVMDLYQYKYRGALEQHVVATVGGRGEVHLGTGLLSPVRFGGSIERNREEFRRYLEVAAPITVIGLLMEVLEDDLYSVDLERLSIVPGRNLRGAPGSTVRLSGLGGNSYVLAHGVFQRDTSADPTDRITIFLAPYGEPGTTARHPVMRMRCVNSGLRDDVPDGPFRARCLGTIQGWDRVAGQLVVNPVAIFR
jgi:hypothetical protein